MAGSRLKVDIQVRCSREKEALDVGLLVSAFTVTNTEAIVELSNEELPQ